MVALLSLGHCNGSHSGQSDWSCKVHTSINRCLSNTSNKQIIRLRNYLHFTHPCQARSSFHLSMCFRALLGNDHIRDDFMRSPHLVKNWEGKFCQGGVQIENVKPLLKFLFPHPFNVGKGNGHAPDSPMFNICRAALTPREGFSTWSRALRGVRGPLAGKCWTSADPEHAQWMPALHSQLPSVFPFPPSPSLHVGSGGIMMNRAAVMSQ